MAHGVIDSATDLYNTAYYRYMGTVYQTASQIFKCGLTQSPASVNNPLVLGYRQPAGWYSRVERWQTSEGQIVWQLAGETWSSMGQLSTFNTGDAAPYTTFDPSLADDILRKVLSEMLEDDVAFNAFLLQGKQSLKMVANLATGIAHGTDRLMEADFKQPKSFRKFLANASEEAISNFSGKYLEFLYGWKPLADDVENAFQSMLDGYTGPEQKRFRLKVKKSRKKKSIIELDRAASTYWTTNYVWRQLLDKVNFAKIVLHYEFPSQAGEMLPTMTPFGTAWEAAPWSFVVDWFVPIGDWVGAMEATQYAIYMHDAVLTQSVKVASQKNSRSRWIYTPKPSLDPGWQISLFQPPAVSGFSYFMTREVLSPVQVLDRIRFPSFSSKFGLPQASQALALLSQVLNKWF